jgi:hypothetical protein
MQIEIDLDVFKALTLLRRKESETYNDVVRRLLTLSEAKATAGDAQDAVRTKPLNILDYYLGPTADHRNGAWIGNVFFPDGTKFRATYKGRTFRAEIKDQVWTDENGMTRKSPSEAAGAISGTKVNGWKFWFAMRPNDDEWHRLDELRK